mgnify:CR=1 FL=1
MLKLYDKGVYLLNGTEIVEEKEAVANLRTTSVSQDNGPKTIGDLIKAQMK